MLGQRVNETDVAVIVCDGSEVCVSWLAMENTKGSVFFSWDTVGAVDTFGSLSFPWDTVGADDTFKRDLFSGDCICLAFETAEGWIEVNEDMTGWRDFLAMVEFSLPEFPALESWYGKVMLPPFETNHARLWERTPGAQNRKRNAENAGAR